MSYWTQKLKDFLTTDRENSLPKLPKGSFVSFGSEFSLSVVRKSLSFWVQ